MEENTDSDMEDESSGMMNMSQRDGPLSDVNPGERVRNLEPGKRVREALGSDDSEMMQSTPMSMPDNPGPSMMGRDPLIGMLRRDMGLPVVRDQLPDLTE